MKILSCLANRFNHPIKLSPLQAIPRVFAVVISLCVVGSNIGWALVEDGRSTENTFTSESFSKAKTIAEVFGVTRGELVSWLESHESDSYYLETPYASGDWRSPQGDTSSWGASSNVATPAMSSTGFVWRALCAAHYWKDDIANKLPPLTSWKDTIYNHELATYSFATKQELLASGTLEKGDLIIVQKNEPDTLNEQNLIGIFWGDTSSQDKIWQSAQKANSELSSANRISNIYTGNEAVLYQVIKLENSTLKAPSSDNIASLAEKTPGLADDTSKKPQGGVASADNSAQEPESSNAATKPTRNKNNSLNTLTAQENIDDDEFARYSEQIRMEEANSLQIASNAEDEPEQEFQMQPEPDFDPIKASDSQQETKQSSGSGQALVIIPKTGEELIAIPFAIVAVLAGALIVISKRKINAAKSQPIPKIGPQLPQCPEWVWPEAWRT